MTSTEPRVRAPLTKAIVQLLDKQPEAVRTAVRARAHDAIEHVEQSSRVDWIPLATQLVILDALREFTGVERYEEFCAAHFASTVEQPFVKGMFDMTVRLFGLGPGGVFRVFPKTWATITRDCGVVEVETVDPQGTTIRIRDLPVAEPRIDLFVRGFRATFRGAIDLFGRAGDVKLVSYDRGARESVYRAHWT